jgi:hypothetical protein
LGTAVAACSGAGSPGSGFQTDDPGAPRVSAPSTEGTLSLPFSVDLDVAGSARVGRVALTGGSGTASVDGHTVAAAVVGRVDFFDQEVYEVLAVSPDRWDVIWVYCREGAARGGYIESTATPGPVASEAIAGTCEEHPDSAQIRVVFPAFAFAPPELPASPVSVEGPGMSWDGRGAGSIVLAGRTLALYPFGAVDCSQRCGDSAWQELHALIWDAEEEAASFAVVYLNEDPTRSVDVAYTVTLPRLTRDAGDVSFPGTTWSYSNEK